MKKCKNCGFENEIEGKFCENCGSPFAEENDSKLRCKHCGAELTNEAFCPDCGKSTGIRICPRCRQKTVNEDYCSTCGYRLNENVKTCRNCGSKIDAKAQVCAKCGAEVADKNPIVALVLSLLFPGLGQVYNDQNHKAITLIIGYVISLVLCLLLVGVILALLIWIFGMYDAFTTAKALNDGKILEDKIF